MILDLESGQVLSSVETTKRAMNILEVNFSHYKFLPGLGFYGFGHYMIVDLRSATILRQLIDAGAGQFTCWLNRIRIRVSTNHYRPSLEISMFWWALKWSFTLQRAKCYIDATFRICGTSRSKICSDCRYASRRKTNAGGTTIAY